MESQIQQPKSGDTTYSEVTEVSEVAPLAKLPPATQSNEQVQQIKRQISVFLTQLPNYISRFFNEYKQPIISVALIVAAIISVKVVLAILNALNSIPLLSPTFELIGIGYSVWFVNRYLLQASNRQELSGELQGLKQQVVGNQQLPESQS